MADSYVFYRSFYEAVQDFDDEQFGRIMRAINEYALNGIEIDLPKEERRFLILMKPNLDANEKKAAKGATGGRPPATFTKPTAEEVKVYCEEKGYRNVNAEQFIGYYESNGWRIGGKSPMKNWKGAVTNWEQMGKNRFGQQQGKQDKEDNAEIKSCPKCKSELVYWNSVTKKYACSLCGYEAAKL